MRRRFLHAVLFLLCLALVAGCGGGPPSAPSIAKKPLTESLAELARSDPAYAKLRAVLVLRDGRTVFEQYYSSSAADHHDVFSVTKSVLSALVGIALADGDLALDDTLAELLPEHRPAMDRATARVTLAQLLTMTGGFGEGIDFPDKATKDWVRPILKRHDAEVGQFTYSNYGAYLVGVVLAEAVGRDLLDYARERLFDPIRIDTRPGAEPLAVAESLSGYQRSEFAWPVDPAGVNVGAGFLRITPREMLAFGKLFLDGGQAGGKQVVPADWVRDSTRPQVQLGDEGYGYLWWTGASGGDPAFSARGFGGQQIEVIPARKTVVVISSEADALDPNQRGVEESGIRLLIDDVILPAYR